MNEEKGITKMDLVETTKCVYKNCISVLGLWLKLNIVICQEVSFTDLEVRTDKNFTWPFRGQR